MNLRLPAYARELIGCFTQLELESQYERLLYGHAK